MISGMKNKNNNNFGLYILTASLWQGAGVSEG